jgi:hypothetical protein
MPTSYSYAAGEKAAKILSRIEALETNQIAMRRELDARLVLIDTKLSALIEVLTGAKSIWRFLVVVGILVGGLSALVATVVKIVKP